MIRSMQKSLQMTWHLQRQSMRIETKIPFVADVNDLWPEAMRMVFDIRSSAIFYFIRSKGMQKRCIR